MKKLALEDPKIVLAHGWAMADWFWQPLIETMNGRSSVTWSAGYFSDDVPCFQVPDCPWIGIGHSFGFQRLLSLDLSHCQALISLCGFWDFCGEGGTSPRTVQRMLRQFSRDPVHVLQGFYQNCGLTFEPPDYLDRERLYVDLNRLTAGEPAELRKKLALEGVPLFAFAGARDKIVPLPMAQSQFDPLTIHPAANHSLGYDQPNWVASQIDRIFNTL